jgi:hypothetical protein
MNKKAGKYLVLPWGAKGVARTLPWYCYSPVWRRYRAARLYYVGGRAEGYVWIVAFLLALTDFLSFSPYVVLRIKDGQTHIISADQ